MRKFTRSDSPYFLKNRWENWGKRYKKNRIENSGFSFQWPTFQGKRINSLLEPLLAIQTEGHCSFCDTYPDRGKEFSIDHFKPKSTPEFYELVCQWENLYICCHNCQLNKKEQYNEYILRPDTDEFSFEKFFIYSYRSHKLDPNPALSEIEKRKAETTINLFGLNDRGHIAARRISLERYESKKKLNEEIVINDFPYRFTIIE